MSGIVNLNAPSYLPTLFSASSPGTSLLSTLYTKGAVAPGKGEPKPAAPPDVTTVPNLSDDQPKHALDLVV